MFPFPKYASVSNVRQHSTGSSPMVVNISARLAPACVSHLFQLEIRPSAVVTARKGVVNTRGRRRVSLTSSWGAGRPVVWSSTWQVIGSRCKVDASDGRLSVSMADGNRVNKTKMLLNKGARIGVHMYSSSCSVHTDRDNYSPLVGSLNTRLCNTAPSRADLKVKLYIATSYSSYVSEQYIWSKFHPHLYRIQILQKFNRFQLLCIMDRALDDVISERQVGTMASAHKQLAAADDHSEKKPAGGQKK